MLSICRRIFAHLAIHDICMICDCAVFSMLRLSCAYAQLSILRSCCLSSSYFSYIILEFMISICRKLSRGRNQKKMFRPWLNFSNPPPTVTPLKAPHEFRPPPPPPFSHPPPSNPARNTFPHHPTHFTTSLVYPLAKPPQHHKQAAPKPPNPINATSALPRNPPKHTNIHAMW